MLGFLTGRKKMNIAVHDSKIVWNLNSGYYDTWAVNHSASGSSSRKTDLKRKYVSVIP